MKDKTSPKTNLPYVVHTEVRWGVLLTRKIDGHSWLAYGQLDWLPALFKKRRDASDYNKKLKEHGCNGGVLRKVKISFSYFS